jgi:phosphate transport system permease protein
LLVLVAILITVFVLIYIIAYILIKGIPYITPSLFYIDYTTENVSLLPALISTVYITFLSLIIAVPLGVISAIYLVEYAKRGNKIVGIIRVMAETLSGYPQ